MNKKPNIAKLIKKLGGLLQEIHVDIATQRGAYQKESDKAVGLFRTHSGLFVPFDEKRFVYQNYDLFILRAYNQLFENVFNAIDETFTATTLRTLQELGVKKVDLLFSSELTDQERSELLLILTLADWSMIGGHYIQSFVAAYDKESNVLNKNAQKHFGAIREHYRQSSDRLPHQLQRDARRYRDTLLDRYYKSRIQSLPFLKGPNLNSLRAFWSELLHGNPFMLEQLFGRENWRNKNRIHAVLWFTGQNALQRLIFNVTDNELRQRAKKFSDFNEATWQQLANEWNDGRPDSEEESQSEGSPNS